MQFDECFEGDYRIFVGALDAPRGQGFIAAVVVSRLTGHAAALAGAPGTDGTSGQRARGTGAREVWRDDSLACGYRWPTPEAALHYAKSRAREMVRKGSPMLDSPVA